MSSSAASVRLTLLPIQKIKFVLPSVSVVTNEANRAPCFLRLIDETLRERVPEILLWLHFIFFRYSFKHQKSSGRCTPRVAALFVCVVNGGMDREKEPAFTLICAIISRF